MPLRTFFDWMADEQEYVQTCGFLTAARLLMKKGDMTERASGELLDQALCAVHSESYHVRNAALLAIRGSICSITKNTLSVFAGWLKEWQIPQWKRSRCSIIW